MTRMAESPFVLDLRDAAEIQLVGGKAKNLGELLRAGLPAPGGFVVTTTTFRAARDGGGMPEEARRAILDAYAAMGRPAVAVRSSATAEDLAEASMAGQYGTHLRVAGDAALLEAIEGCWQSMQREGLRAYLQKHGVAYNAVAMAVVVQTMVPSDVAGVAFSTDPRAGATPAVMVEAAWGLGEAVVSGQVQPDTYRLDAATGATIEARISDKAEWFPPRGAHGKQPVPAERRKLAALTHGQLREIWALCKRVAEHFGQPQDIEWGIAGEQLYLLQSRPITTLDHAEDPDAVIAEIKQTLKAAGARGEGPWVLHNLGETVPRPTPLTWSVLKRFMTGAGGFGAMYRMAGYEPGERVQTAGFLELIGGRIYMDASRAAEMFHANYPYAYDLEQLKQNPQAAQDPPTVTKAGAGARAAANRLSRRVYERLKTMAATLDRELREKDFPAFKTWCSEQRRIDLPSLSNADLAALWHTREHRVMDEFGPRSLLPSMVAGWALQELKNFLAEHCWDVDAEALASELAVGAPPDQTFSANAGLYRAGKGQMTLAAWMASFGHRGPGEFDLAAPRWSELPEDVTRLAAQLAAGDDPQERRQALDHQSQKKRQEIAAHLTPRARRDFEQKLQMVDRYLPFREDGKYFLMLGYGLLRDVACEAGQRLGIGNDVFHLTREELTSALQTGFAPDAPIVARRRRARAHDLIDLPRVISADGLELLGKPQVASDADQLPAFALSRGFATGPARIRHSPTQAGDLGRGYILVAPSTDPAWTPLFINAAALVLECGGALSHGAVVAREMGLPAVVLPNATKLLEENETVLVDGNAGAVIRNVAGGAMPQHVDADATSLKIDATQLPPPAGDFERGIGRLRNKAFVMWGIYLVLAFALPTAWLYGPTMSVFDALLWPLVRELDRPGATAIIGIALAVLTMVMQRFLTDNKRLRVARQRQAALQKEAAKLPEDSPRRAALLAAAAPVSTRLLGAAFVPIGLLLGPMVMLFFWLPARVDPSTTNPPAGTPVVVSAEVRGEWTEGVTILTKLELKDNTPATQTPPPIRATLEKLRAQLARHDDAATMPSIPTLAGKSRQEVLAALEEHLKKPLPSNTLAWPLVTPKESGKFPVMVRTGGQAETVFVALGADVPPAESELTFPPHSPLEKVKVIYPKFRQVEAFYKPAGLPFDLGWLGVYLIAYLPAMLLSRWILRVA